MPEEPAVTGCGDDPFTSLPMFALTTIRFDIETGRKSQTGFSPPKSSSRLPVGGNSLPTRLPLPIKPPPTQPRNTQ